MLIPKVLIHLFYVFGREACSEVPASTRDESLLHSTKCRGVSRGPSKLHSIPDFSEAL